MGSLKSYALAGVLTLAAGGALAADLLPGPPPMPMPPPVEVGGGWYLRGDIGITNQDFDRIDFPAAGTFDTLSKGLDSSVFAGGGVGYSFGSWIRADLTAEYRGKSSLHGLERYPAGGGFPPPVGGTDEYRGLLSSVVTLANLYIDLGTWHGITPFIGAGVGGAYNMLDNFVDVNTPNGGVAFGEANKKWNLAWAVHAGLAYKISPSFTLELAYRYLNLGDAGTKDLSTYIAACAAPCTRFTAKDIDSHDVKIGLRWALGGEHYAPAAYAPPPPLMRKY